MGHADIVSVMVISGELYSAMLKPSVYCPLSLFSGPTKTHFFIMPPGYKYGSFVVTVVTFHSLGYQNENPKSASVYLLMPGTETDESSFNITVVLSMTLELPFAFSTISLAIYVPVTTRPSLAGLYTCVKVQPERVHDIGNDSEPSPKLMYGALRSGENGYENVIESGTEPDTGEAVNLPSLGTDA